MKKLSPGLLKFEDIRNGIKDSFSETNEFSFLEGSNFSILNDFLAYHDMLVNYSVANVANEVFLKTCNSRNSAVKIANKMNYCPRRKIAAKIVGKIRFLGANVNNIEFTVGEISFVGKKKGYTFLAKNVVFKKNNGYFEASFVAEEKKASRYVYIPTNDLSQTFTITNENISSDNLVVYSYAGDVFTSYESMSEYSFVPNSLSTIYHLSEDEDFEFCPKITFGDGVIGKIPNNTETVYVDFYETHGVDGNGETGLTVGGVKTSSAIVVGMDEISNYKIIANSTSFGGRENETLEEIKISAPGFYSAKQRGVLKSDYLSLLSNQPNVQFIDVMGSDEIKSNSLQTMGRIFISVVPSDLRDPLITSKFQSFPLEAIKSLSLSEYNAYGTINSLIDNVKDKTVLSTKVSLVSPSYLYVNIQPFIELKNSYQNFDVVAQGVFEDLSNYANENLFGIGKKYRENNLSDRISVLDGVLSSRIETTLSLLVNEKNITDNYYVMVPKDLIKTNYEQYREDIVFNKYNYSYSEMPLERRTIYCKIKNSLHYDETGFERYIANDNFVFKTALQTFAQVKIDRVSENVIKFNINESYSSKIIGSNKTLNTFLYSFDDVTGLLSENTLIPVDSVPNKIDIVSGAYDAGDTSFYGKPLGSKDCWFMYIKEGSSLYLAVIFYVDSDFQMKVLYNNDNSAATNVLNSAGLVLKPGQANNSTNKFFYFSIEETFNLQNKNYSGFKVNVRYCVSTESQESGSENIKLYSKYKIADLYFDKDFSVKSRGVNTHAANGIFTTESVFKDLKVKINGTDLLEIARNTTGEMEIVKTNNYPENIAAFKNGKFEVKKISDYYELYAFEVINDCTIGYLDRENDVMNFLENVVYTTDVNSGEVKRIPLISLFETFGIFELVGVNEIKITQKNTYNDSGDVIGNKSDFNAMFGICIIPNVNVPRGKIV